MEVNLAKTAGFCFGVKRAIDTVYEQIETGKKIYTFGPIIHNEEVVKDLEQKGVVVLENEEALKQVKKGTIIIRSHGVSKAIYDLIEENGLEIVDATCPFVKKIHNIVEKESQAGRKIVIIGSANHPEVQGIVGWSITEPIVIENMEATLNVNINKNEKVCIVSQTTFNYKKFQELVEFFSKKGYDINVVNTICNATEERQTEARDISSKSDTMIVIGGTHSSNTRKLYEICQRECENTYFIQTLKDLRLDERREMQVVGITAGASTPNNIIEEVQNYVRINF